MERHLHALVQICPRGSERIVDKLKSIDLILEQSVDNIKIAMNDAIDKRDLDQLDELQGLLKAITAGQEKLGSYIAGLLPGETSTTKDLQQSTTPGRSRKKSRGRGIVVQIDDQIIDAGTVKELFLGVLKGLDADGKLEELVPLLPYATSSRRYLLSWQPVHPNKKAFFAPLEYEGIYIETNKSYKNAIADLEKLLPKLGISFEVIELGELNKSS